MKPVRTSNIFLYVLFSTLFLLFPVFSSPDLPDLKMIFANRIAQKELTSHALLLILFFCSYCWWVPRLLLRNRTKLFYFIIIVCGLLFLWGLSCFHIKEPKAFMPPPDTINGAGTQMTPAVEMQPAPGHDSHPRNLLHELFFNFDFYLYVITVFVSVLLQLNRQQRRLKEEKLSSELSYLKAQIHPHFLFNTLNSIYSLALEKSDYTATAVLKLSGMMRYLITDADKDFVPLEKELEYINDYIQLQKFRLGNTVALEIESSGDASHKMIAPLIIVTFVENAFKYGVSPDAISRIVILKKIVGNTLYIWVKNNVIPDKVKYKESASIGLKNTLQRLEMLYPGRYHLDIKHNEKEYIVDLKIEL